MRVRRRGFSLVEIVAVLVLLALIAAIALGGRGSQEARGATRALAMDLVSELRACRAQALSTATPVAACFPGEGAPHSQSMYVMSGQAMGRIRRVRDWSNDYPEAVLAVGYWGIPAARPDQTEVRKKVDPASWLASDFKDYAVIFAADGRVASNDLPVSQGAYKILVCGSLDYALGALSGPTIMGTPTPAFLIQRAATPYTISIDPDGNISVDSGAPGLTVEANPFAMAQPPTSARSMPPFVAGAPTIDTVEVLPKPVIDPVATVVQGGNLNITIRASDPSGDDLFVTWSASKASGAASGNGAFSSQEKQRMSWLPAERKWTTQITWTPPLDAQIGDRFDLDCAVSNSAGTAVSASSALLRDVTVRKDEMVFLSDDSGIVSMQTNGTGMKQVVSAGEPWHVNVSPDGMRMLWEQNAYDRDALYVANIDGTDPVFITSDPSQYYLQAQWNPTATKIYLRGSYSMIKSINIDGTGKAELRPRIPGLSGASAFEITPDSRYIVSMAGAERTPGDRDSYARDLWMAELDESVEPPVVRDWTNLTKHLPKHPGGDTSVFLTLLPKTSDPTRPSALFRGNGSDQVVLADLQDRGVGEDPRFVATLSSITDSRTGRAARFWDISFSPEGDKACITETNFGGASVADWSATTRTLSNLKKITTRSFRMVDWR